MRIIVALFLLLSFGASAQPSGGGGGPGPVNPCPGNNCSNANVTATGGTTAETFAALAQQNGLSVISTGAKCDGTTNDASAINTALSSGFLTVLVPPQACRAASTITVPAGVTLKGLAFNPGNPPSGSEIVCDLSVTPCVSMSGNTNGQAPLQSITIGRAAGTPSSTAIGILVNGAYNAILTDVMSYNHGICYEFLANPSGGTGLGAVLTRGYSGKCLDTHIFASSWPELKIISGRYGMNGNGDYSSNAFIRISGGVGSTAGGPNTIYATGGAQFNQGSNSVTHFVEFTNLGAAGVPSIDATDFRFEGAHIEGISGAIVYTDSTWNILNRLFFNNNSINTGSIPFFALNSATEPSVVILSGNEFAGSDITLSGQTGLPIIAAILTDNTLNTGSIVMTGTSGSTAIVAHNSVANGINVSGVWGNLDVGPNIYVGGSLTNTATGQVNVFEPTSFTTATPLTISTNAQAVPFTINGVNTGSYVQQTILNNTANSSSSVRTQWATAASGVDVLMSVFNSASTPSAQIFADGGITGDLQIVTDSSTSGIGLWPNSTQTFKASRTLNQSYVPIQLEAYTVSTLPTCNSGIQYSIAMVTDALTPTYNGTLTGGSSTKVPVFCNGSAWTSH